MLTTFREHGYVAAPRILSSQLCDVATRYALMQEAAGASPDEQVPGAHSMYGDLMTESVLEMLWPEMERISGHALWPTYSYFRVYRPGDVLAPHRDRLACEISATVCLGVDTGDAGLWPLWVRPLSPADAEPVPCAMVPGDMVVYRGCDVEHWREAFRGQWQVQAFLHYVRRDGPYAAMAKFDARPALGTPESARDRETVARMAAVDTFLRNGRAGR
jgi:hypothetical protein